MKGAHAFVGCCIFFSSAKDRDLLLAHTSGQVVMDAVQNGTFGAVNVINEGNEFLLVCLYAQVRSFPYGKRARNT